jgi:hypothetical protein
LCYLIGTVVIIAYSLFSVKSFGKQFFAFVFALEMLACVHERTLEGVFLPAEARGSLSHARPSLSSR